MLEPGFSNWPSKVALLTYRWSSGELPHNQATAVDVCIILCSFSCNFTLVNCILSFISWSLNCTFCIECVYQACPVSCAIVPSVVIRSSLLSCCYNSIRFYEIKKKTLYLLETELWAHNGAIVFCGKLLISNSGTCCQELLPRFHDAHFS